MKTPPALNPGDTIGFVCPSSRVPPENYLDCIDVFHQWGFETLIGSNAGKQQHYFSASDLQRAAEMQEMLDNKQVKAIFCLRGGYGMSRIIDLLDFSTLTNHPKWIAGFSDITLLLQHLAATCGIQSLHSPMASAFKLNQGNIPPLQMLRKILTGEKTTLTAKPHHLNRNGNAKGVLTGGNLSMVVHAIGTISFYLPKDAILFLEDVGEHLYKIDRMIIQLKRNGIFSSLQGIVFGGFTAVEDTTPPFGEGIADILHFHCKDLEIPYCFNFPVGHQEENFPLILGGKYQFKVSNESSSLSLL